MGRELINNIQDIIRSIRNIFWIAVLYYLAIFIITVLLFSEIIDNTWIIFLLSIFIFIVFVVLVINNEIEKELTLDTNRYLRFRRDLYHAMIVVHKMEAYKNIKYYEFVSQWMLHNMRSEIADMFIPKICNDMYANDILEILDEYVYTTSKYTTRAYDKLIMDVSISSSRDYLDDCIKNKKKYYEYQE